MGSHSNPQISNPGRKGVARDTIHPAFGWVDLLDFADVIPYSKNSCTSGNKNFKLIQSDICIKAKSGHISTQWPLNWYIQVALCLMVNFLYSRSTCIWMDSFSFLANALPERPGPAIRTPISQPVLLPKNFQTGPILYIYIQVIMALDQIYQFLAYINVWIKCTKNLVHLFVLHVLSEILLTNQFANTLSQNRDKCDPSVKMRLLRSSWCKSSTFSHL